MHVTLSGVFTSLRYGHEVVYQDVDAAINRICEESTPLEIDITHFVHRLVTVVFC